MEARLSLRAAEPDPFQAFADGTAVGDALRGQVTRLVPIGVFVRVADDVVGLVRPGDEVAVVVTAIDRELRRLTLSWQEGSPENR